MMKIRLAYIFIVAVSWAYIPLAMTLLFWFKPIFGVTALMLSIIGLICSIKNVIEKCEDKTIQISWPILILATILLLWMVIVGIGGFWTQEQWDNGYRNAVLYELVYNPWPVVKGNEYLSYYFSFWLPAAFIGKIFNSIVAAQMALFAYCYVGLIISVIMVIIYCGRKPFLAGCLFFLICGWDWIGVIIFRNILHWSETLYTGSVIAQAPSVLYLCRFIYNQGIPALVILPLMWFFRKEYGLQLFFFSLLFIVAPFICLPIAFILAITFICHLKESISISNISGFVICLLMSVFFIGNSNGSHIHFIYEDEETPVQVWIMFATYLLTNFCVFIPFIWKEIKSDRLFWMLLFFSCPFIFIITGSYTNDFGLKVPTALTLYIFYKVIKRATSMPKDISLLKKCTFYIVIIIGFFGNYDIYDKVIEQHREVRHNPLNPDCRRAIWLQGRLFEEFGRNACRENFVTQMPTIYSRYLMPNPDSTL